LGKKILLSFGGASGSYSFADNTAATTFAQTVWNMFLGGTSSSLPRPFGSAVLDGVDLDIEGGSSIGYATFTTALRQLFATDSTKSYYISGTPL
jgi:chitinase